MNRDSLVVLHLRVVEQVLNQVSSHLHPSAATTRDELRSAGYLGLIQAADVYDKRRGVPFGAFARRRVHGAMLDELRARDVGRRRRDLNKAGRDADRQLRQELGREPAREEVAARLDVEARTFDRVAVLIAEPAFNSDAILARQTAPELSPEAQTIDADRVARVKRAVRVLPTREQIVLQRYYEDEWSMKQISAEIGVNESRVSQLHARAIRMLRQMLTSGFDL